MAALGSNASSSSLINLVRRHDEEAWGRFTRIYGPTVYRWCLSAHLQRADAADVVQEVFQAVAVHIENFRHDRAGDSFRGWLWKIFQSKLMDFFRQSKNFPIACDEPTLDGLWNSMRARFESGSERSQENARLLRRALEVIRGDFSERTWSAFWRSAVMKERTSHIARDLEVTPSAVCVARSRVIRRLRETVDGLDILPEG
jgi:RNA polymerase sigma-70 factor (ECF subfamily)